MYILNSIHGEIIHNHHDCVLRIYFAFLWLNHQNPCLPYGDTRTHSQSANSIERIAFAYVSISLFHSKIQLKRSSFESNWFPIANWELYSVNINGKLQIHTSEMKCFTLINWLNIVWYIVNSYHHWSSLAHFYRSMTIANVAASTPFILRLNGGIRGWAFKSDEAEELLPMHYGIHLWK